MNGIGLIGARGNGLSIIPRIETMGCYHLGLCGHP